MNKFKVEASNKSF